MKTKLAALAALGVGLTMLFLTVPDFLLKLEIAGGSALALAYGYSAWSPRAPAWLLCQPVRGMICIYAGCACVFIPVQFLISALLLGVGTRLVMTSFTPPGPPPPSAPLARKPGDIVLRQSSRVATRDYQP